MADRIEWLDKHTTYAKGATWWSRAMPYLIEDSDGRWTVYGDWWDEDRLAALSIWQHECARALRDLMADDDNQHRVATLGILAKRAARETRAELSGGWSFATWWSKVRTKPDLTDDERRLIALEAARRITVREAVRTFVADEIDHHPTCAAARLYSGHPSTWTDSQIANAALGHGDLLLRLARARHLPSPPPFIVPPHLHAAPLARDPSEPATADA